MADGGVEQLAEGSSLRNVADCGRWQMAERCVDTALVGGISGSIALHALL